MTRPPPYSPMDCERYSELELAIVRRRALRLRWIGRAVTHLEVVYPEDLRTRRHGEYLVLRDQLHRRRFLRLDRITDFSELGPAEVEPAAKSRP
ncbi:transcriptional antiterminator, Rof [Thioalkalivibrio nitratireducens DSM 14787]|uniref:Transcriptional antiterminator, Rof n=1 Tax=Thioalkalivibrio nitratireducens (strain DSM 14787 / UNIQEM 213 / ALEN2) TaxID=1255043 RepID=L0E066_THIND|nr:transcriptional antiterminator, Rof [Thioalkalivibrio nitratireducens]AGA35234.1 transcriptional antiterminator, Rof [Thioalkalivibrio nitratireducens DSM 14787]